MLLLPQKKDFPSTLPGAPTSARRNRFFLCTGDIANYDPSIANNAREDPVYQPTNNIVTIPYGMGGGLSSGIEKTPLCGHYVRIENPANGKPARVMVVDKFLGCVSC